MFKKSLFKKVHPATVAVWAALLAVSSLLPAIPLIGVGGTMSISNALLPLAGIMFGPWAGALVAAIGGFIGQLLAPATAAFGIWTFLIGVIFALHAGFMAEGKKIPSIILPIIPAILWMTNPIGRSVPEELIFIGLGFIFSILGCTIGAKFLLEKKNVATLFVAILFIAFASFVTSSMFANWLALLMYQLPREAWLAVLALAPIERFIFSIAAGIIGVPLLMGLPKVGVAVGPMLPEEEGSVDVDAPIE